MFPIIERGETAIAGSCCNKQLYNLISPRLDLNSFTQLNEYVIVPPTKSSADFAFSKFGSLRGERGESGEEHKRECCEQVRNEIVNNA